LGNSMGGAVALQALAIDARLQFGIIQCPFADLKSVVHAYQKRYAQGFELPTFTDKTIKRAGEIAHFNPDEVCPVCVAPTIKQPVLLLHGEKDVNIPVGDTYRLYDALGSVRKEKMIIKEADHYTIISVGGEAVINKMKHWADGTYQ
jgi:uncharacterized protein